MEYRFAEEAARAYLEGNCISISEKKCSERRD